MIVALILFFAVPVMLLVAGVAVIVTAALSLRARRAARAPAALRIVAGAGLVACACLATAAVFADVQYAIVILPLTALALATAWSVVFFGAAWIVAAVSSRHRR